MLISALHSLYKLGTQGHIEDVAVRSDQQGKRLGVKLLQALDHIAEQVGCYKVRFPQGSILKQGTNKRAKTILDCSPEKEGFYVKCGYEKAGSEMHHYYDHEAEEHGV